MTSEVASVTIKAAEEGIETPAITEQPTEAEYIVGGKDSAEALKVVAQVSKGQLSYQWYSSKTNSYEGAEKIADATSAEYVPQLTEVGTMYYFCEITNTDASSGETLTSVIKSKIVSVSLNYDYTGFTFETIDETTCKLVKYTGDSLTPIVPETDQEGRKVVEIGNSVFAESAIEEVTIPSTVEKLGSLSTLGTGYGTDKDGVFYNCTALKTIHFEGQLTVVGDFSFSKCTALETNIWEFCKNVENIGKGAFQALGCLPEELVMPESLKTIDKYAFQSSTGVKKLSFAGNGVTQIYGATFAKMPDLEEVTIPSSITNLGDSFKEDYALKSFTYTRSVSTDGSITADNPFGTSKAADYPNLVINVPTDSVEEYSAILGDFAQKIHKEA